MAAVKQHWTTRVGLATGHPAAFPVVIVYGLLWHYFSKAIFEWNAVATLAVWVMTLFIQGSNRRDTLALHDSFVFYQQHRETMGLGLFQIAGPLVGAPTNPIRFAQQLQSLCKMLPS